MSLRGLLCSQGEWMFKQRSWLPLLLVPFAALAFTQYSYLGGSRVLDGLWSLGCVLVCLAGLAIRAATTGTTPRRTSGRNTKGQVADELNTTGMYSIVRNPLYLGNFLMGLGPALFFHSWWLPTLYTVVFWAYYGCIVLAEEKFLREKFGAAYIEYTKKTPAFLPRLRGWRPPALPFSFRTVLKREYQTAFGAAMIFCCLDVAGDSVQARALVIDVPCIAALCASVMAYGVLRFLRKNTRVLHVAGR
ncbi:MAG TPA: isoprenylcysteine carboxylmethyltransferase family protein [Planctomycetota bacterium]|nr:lipid A Kdo2 1-phosphate O-methyltransferase [Planctomycetota bacterium]OQC20165.1 MAG: hypothetical protein BWX69_02075 [Planctomycetes bacterium ADurb.Bin069]NMD35941.1 lipid A Kdo2 1-phosphate O-methyltransferase [Planctomycetota bacterium]HNR99306.1 isoprenylcysteine carboxylmethyltransferase family protein [Planctomycetota bacterium]HNU26079.1 isoprenylcysteine carboxylmethyltransferase family protein [Planctomycetota bacterium]